MKVFYCLLFLICQSCIRSSNGTFNSKKFESSAGEKIYLNTINWGVNDDSQLSVVSKDNLRLQDSKDTVGAIYGLDPFIVRFRSDTLTLYFYDHISYKVNEKFNTISVVYKVVNSEEYLKLKE